MRTSEATSELTTALSKAQGEIENALKESNNPYFSSKYADLATVINAAKPSLAKYGLSVMQSPIQTEDTKWTLITRLSHSSGQWVEGDCPILTNKADAQGFGSGLTYARRYALAAMLGIAQEDDDGNGASKGTPPENKKKVEEPPVSHPKKPENELNKPATANQLTGLMALAQTKGIKNDVMSEFIKLKTGKQKAKDLSQLEITGIMSLIKTRSMDELNEELITLRTENEIKKVEQGTAEETVTK